MDRDPLVAAFFSRSESAIAEARQKYGAGLRRLSYGILGSKEDAEEIENDVYLEAWNKIPPAEPESLKSYLFMICRRRSLDRMKEKLAQKRGGGEAAVTLEELEQILPGEDGRDWAEQICLRETLRRFLERLPKRERVVFMQRYWYFLSISEIAEEQMLSENHVKVLLYRTRQKLKDQLKKEEL